MDAEGKGSTFLFLFQKMAAKIMEEQGRWDFFRFLALSCCAFSLASILFLAITIPWLYVQMEEDRAQIAAKSRQFREKSNQLWSKMVPNGEEGEENGAGGIRRHRAILQAGGICEGCKPLTCNPGQIGPPGPPGEDAQPGGMGQPGIPGEDGLDIALGPEQDQPCTVCPGGPPGMRGNQGERGMRGEQGMGGAPGEHGQIGVDGPPGLPGPPGNSGAKGDEGCQGAPGDRIIAGVGQKGPKGPPGAMGLAGMVGMPGKARMTQGMPGPQGPIGPEGLPGQSGQQGQPGMAGTPGEPGQPSTFCPADCGVSHIKVPGFSRKTEVEEKKAPGIMPPPKYGGERRRKHSNDDDFGGEGNWGREMRRHPVGGYYWQK